MLWFLFKRFKKELSDYALVYKFGDKKGWIIFVVLMLINVCISLISSLLKVYWLVPIYLISSLIIGSWQGSRMINEREKLYGNVRDYHKRKLIILRGILSDNGLYTRDKIEYLISLSQSEVENLKLSKKLFNSINFSITLIFMPIVFLILDWLLNYDSSEAVSIAINIVTIIALSVSLVLILKPILESFLDADFKKMRNMRELLEDLIIIDFLE